MAEEKDPVVLELAPLPREQLGPFLILGVDKSAGEKEIEANWAQRVIWARKNQIRIALGDINWAREVINDPERRVRADLTSLNFDTALGVLQCLREQYGAAKAGTNWQPLDVEKSLDEFVPPAEVPDAAAVLSAITIPEARTEIPGVLGLLQAFVQEPLDPWSLKFNASEQDGAHE
jgi:hypothetical protein